MLRSTALLQIGCVVALLNSEPLLAQQQIADPEFNTKVQKPAYMGKGPTVAIDEAHLNFHTAGNRYKPLADLLNSDGYEVVPWTKQFEAGSLAGVKVLIIANAGSPQAGATYSPAFTESECDVVRDWVRDGGSLLLIADHAPFGLAAENLAKKFGVAMGKGWVFDRNAKGEFTTQLVFTQENGLLGSHVALRGRNASEEVKHIRSFTGQSLSIPDGATVLMKLSPTAREAATAVALNAAATAAAASDQPLEATTKEHSTSVAGRAQGIAMPFGKGRLAVMGEAAMFSAQIIKLTVGNEQREIKAGMNVVGTDDRQFAINLMHWLSGLLN
jgi:hypothetical protein